MLFYSFFKSLVGKDVVVELKNDLSICGTLHSVDQYLNIKLTDITVTDPDKHPHMTSVKSCFIRGSVVRYVQLPSDEVDTQLLQDDVGSDHKFFSAWSRPRPGSQPGSGSAIQIQITIPYPKRGSRSSKRYYSYFFHQRVVVVMLGEWHKHLIFSSFL